MLKNWRSLSLGAAVVFLLIFVAVSSFRGGVSSYFAPQLPTLPPPVIPQPVIAVAPTESPSSSTPEGGQQERARISSPTPTQIPLPTAPMSPSADTDLTPASAEPRLLNQGKIAFEAGGDGKWQIYVADPANGQVSLLPMQPQNSRVPSWSPDGNYLAFRSRKSGFWQVYTIRIDGSELKQLTTTGGNYEGVWSPDGTRIAFVSDRDGNKEIYIMSADGTDQRRLTNNPRIDDDPSWSPDGNWIVFESARNGRTDIYRIAPDGKQLTRLTAAGDSNYTPAWSPDDQWIAFEQRTGRSQAHYAIWRMRPDGSGLQRLTAGETDAGRATWSPDSRAIAYTSNRDGTYGIWILEIGTEIPPIRLSVLEGYNAAWSHGR